MKLLLVLLVFLSSISIAEDWPQWRGTRSDSTWKTTSQNWPKAGPTKVWSQVIGKGYSGISVKDGRAYTMDRELAKEGKKPDGFERVLCFVANTGKTLWIYKYPAHYGKLGYGKGPRTTPTICDGKVYILGTMGHLACLNAVTGKIIWSYDLVKKYKAVVPTWGFATSPVIYKDMVIVHIAANPNGSLLAFNRLSGKEVWRSLSDQAGYSTPIIFSHKNKPHMALWTPKHIFGVHPDTGKELWRIPYNASYECSIVSPIFHKGIILISNGADGSKAIKLDNKHQGKILWQDKRKGRSMISQILYRNGYVYVLDKTHGLTCLELQTGKKIWDDENRLVARGRNNHIFPAWMDNNGKIISLNSGGELILAHITPQKFTEHSRAKIIDHTWAHPAYAGNKVYARSDTQIVCVSLTAEK